MPTIQEDLTQLETHIVALNQNASKVTAASLADGRKFLVHLANKIKSPNQSKNDTYYNLGAPVVQEAEGVKSASMVLSFDTVQANTGLAQQILAKSEETVSRIDKLAASGRKFNAARAKADVHDVTSKVAGILKTDLTASWVHDDLNKLASRADHLHGLFVSKPKS